MSRSLIGCLGQDGFLLGHSHSFGSRVSLQFGWGHIGAAARIYRTGCECSNAMHPTSKSSAFNPKKRCWGIVPASKPIRSFGWGNDSRQADMSLTSQGRSCASSVVPLLSTMQTAQDRSDTSIPAKYSNFFLPCSQSLCDLFGSLTSEQRQPNYAC